jgi:glycosyltransferase involved in cell wall biosynthesis
VPSFVYAGRLHPVKGIDMLLRAFARLRRRHPEARLRVRGEGQAREELLALAAELSLDGSVAFDVDMAPDWHDLLEDAWALVAPSRFREPFGLVAAEAVVRRVPVIASEGGGFGETVEHGVSGLLFPNGDEAALEERMEAVCRGDGLPDLVVEERAAERIARRHDVPAHVERLHRIWEGIGA